MSRLQLALNVADLDEAIAFYMKLFGTEPAKRKAGYANFAIADPPLKLVLFENAEATNRLNHLGVEAASTDEGPPTRLALPVRASPRSTRAAPAASPARTRCGSTPPMADGRSTRC